MSKYDDNVKPRLKDIKDWARNGVIEKDIAKNLKISYSRFREYKAQFGELAEALKEGEEQANDVVESALFQRATGMTVKVNKWFKVRKIEYDEKGRKKSETEDLEMREEEEYFPPDPTSMIFWLKNRRADKWRDRVENALTMEDGLQVFFEIPRAGKDASDS